MLKIPVLKELAITCVVFCFCCNRAGNMKEKETPVPKADDSTAQKPQAAPDKMKNIVQWGVQVTVPDDWTTALDQGWLRIYGSLSAPIVLRKMDSPLPENLEEAVKLWGVSSSKVQLLEGDITEEGLLFGIIKHQVRVGSPGTKDGKHFHMLEWVHEAHASMGLSETSHVHCSFHCGPDCPQSSVDEALKICKTMKKVK